MNIPKLIEQFLEVPNALALGSFAVAVLALLFSIWIFYIPRKINVTATAELPIIWFEPSKRPFTITITNKNTRQVKIDKIGFETFMRPFGYFESTYSAGLLKTEKLLVTEADRTDITFDLNKITRDMGSSLSAQTNTYRPKMLKIWIYLTHGSRISAKIDAKLEEQFRAAIVSAVASASQRES